MCFLVSWVWEEAKDCMSIDEEPQLSDVLDSDSGDLGNLSMVAQFTNFLSKIYNIGEKDKFKYVSDKTRLDENQIIYLSYGVSDIDTAIRNDLRTVFHCTEKEMEELDKIHLPLVDASIQFMHLRISLHGQEREEWTRMMMPPDLRDQYKEEPSRLSMSERIRGVIK